MNNLTKEELKRYRELIINELSAFLKECPICKQKFRHPSAPVISTGKKIPNGCYFESHIGVVIKPEEKKALNYLVEKLNSEEEEILELSGTVKLSQNFFKKSKDDSKFVNMLTYRSNMCGSPKFKLEVEGIKHILDDRGFDYEKVEVEYAVYDTNVTHDAKWIMS